MANVRRVTKSSVEWARLIQAFPQQNQELVHSLRTKTATFEGRVNHYPAELPKIDFQKYKEGGVSANFVDSFEKSFNALSIPYPKDPQNLKTEIEKKAKLMKSLSDEIVRVNEATAKTYKDYVVAAEKVPHVDAMTREMFYDYFPEQAISQAEPHTNTYGYDLADIEQDEHDKVGAPTREYMEERFERIKDYHMLRGQFLENYKMANPDEFPEWAAEQEKKEQQRLLKEQEEKHMGELSEEQQRLQAQKK